MSRLDGQDIFGSGPHEFRAGGWERAMQRRSFPGLGGELVLDGGLRGRPIVQTGRLQADTQASLLAQVRAVEAFADGRTHTLSDNAGRSLPKVLVESFELTSPLRRGRGWWCEYRIQYRQLP